MLPYLTGCLGGGIQFHWGGLARLVAMALVFGLWYRVWHAHSTIADLAFLALIPLVLLSGYLEAIYIAVHPALKKDLIELGHVALIEIAVPVLMVARGVRTGYGFFPTRAEWTIGLRHYLYFAAVGFPLALALEAGAFHGPRAAMEDRRHIPGLLLGDRPLRGVLRPWGAPGLVGAVDQAGLPGALGRLHPVRRRPPLLSGLPQLALGPPHRHPGLVLRPRAQSGGRHSRRRGHARARGHYLESLPGVIGSDDCFTRVPCPQSWTGEETGGCEDAAHSLQPRAEQP